MAAQDGTTVTPASTQYETDTTHDSEARHTNMKEIKVVVAEPTPVETPALEKGDGIEDANEQYASRPWLRRLLKHWRHPLYAGIWLLFTG
jgi:CNT family concentrative nucleoside transporter